MVSSCKEAEVKDVQVEKQAAANPHGWMRHAPGSWLHLFITGLPAQDRLSAFQSCRWLARHVLDSAPTVTLRLTGQTPPGQLCMRQRALAQLLEGTCHSLTVVLSQPGAKPFPPTLSATMVALELFSTALGRDSSDHSYDWAAFSRLQQLKFILAATAHDIRKLCDALEAGQLQQLQKFSLYQQRITNAALLKRLALAFGAQLLHLGTSITGLLQHAPLLTALRSLDLHGCSLGCDVMHKLYEHTTLHTIRLRDCKLEQDDSKQHCMWRTLILCDVEWGLLASLPLAGLQEIRFVGEIREPKDEHDSHTITHTIKQHASRIICEPGEALDGTVQFSMNGLYAETVDWVRFLRVPCKVAVWGAIQEPGLIQALWLALPACVHTVEFATLPPERIDQNIDWLQLWHQLPATVQCIDLCGCWVPADVLLQMVQTVPPHVRVMGLSHWQATERAAWDKVALLGAAASHLTVHLD